MSLTIGLTTSMLASIYVSPAAAARILVSSSTPIRSFAQDGQFVAWSDKQPGSFGCGRVYVRDLATGRQRWFIGKFDLNVCSNTIALARGRVIWPAEAISCGNCFGTTLFTAALGDPRVSVLGEFVEAPASGGLALTGFTGGASTTPFRQWATGSSTKPAWTCLSRAFGM